MKLHLTYFLFIICFFTFSQTPKNNPVSTFHQFDLIKKSDSVVWTLQTNKIKFIKSSLDTIKSKPCLDSIHWFLTRHPNARVEILLMKNDRPGKEYRTSAIAQNQTKQLVEYLMKKGIDIQRLLHNGNCNCLELKGPNEDVKKRKANKTGIILTRIRVL